MEVTKKKIRICFLADKHELYDDRIYWKMAVPLANKEYDVHYLLIGDRSETGITKEGIAFEVIKIKTLSSNRYLNFLLKNLNPNNNYKLLYRKSKKIEADIYHFHDLWINKIGKKLKSLDHKPVVFYDAREPYAEDYISYTTSKGFLKICIKIFAKFVDVWEKRSARNYDLVISNEDIVRDKFRQKIGVKKAETLYNFTDIYKNYNETLFEDKKFDFIYCGGVSVLRGAFKIVEATLEAKKKLPNIKVAIVGKYSPNNLKNELQNFIDNKKLNQNIILFSAVNYSEISKFYNDSRIGLVTLFPVPTFKVSMPIKIFEYMAFGMPIIGSDFGHIKEYIENENCGITVDPKNSDQIAKAMIEILTDKKKYKLFSINGRKATLEKFKWEFEFERLLNFYNRSLNEKNKL